MSSGKSFDGGARLAKMTAATSKSNVPDIVLEDNLFAGLKNNRYVQVIILIFFAFFLSDLSPKYPKFSIFTPVAFAKDGWPGAGPCSSQFHTAPRSLGF